MSFTLYRSYHLDHHRIVNMPHDTDRVQTSRWTSSPALSRLLRIALFTALYPAYWALRVRRHYRVLSTPRKVRVWLELAVAYAALFALHPVMGGVAWATFFVSLVTTSFVLASLTTMAEHFDVDYHDDPAYTSRTYATESLVIDWFWGSSTYHVEHHGFPGIPYYNLRAFHREALPYYPPEVRRNVHRGFWRTIFTLLRRVWTTSVEEERARARRDVAEIAERSGLAGADGAQAFATRRGRGTLARPVRAPTWKAC
jgi:fatty acid desaturase